MGYDDETMRSKQRRSRARQSGRPERGRKADYRAGEEPGQSGAGLNLITQQSKSDIFRNPARRKKKRKWKLCIIFLELVVLLGVLAFAGYSYVNSRLDLMVPLPWDPDEVKNMEISAEKQEQMKGYWSIAIFGVDSRNSSVGKGNNADVNIICNINQDTGEIRLVSVYRDAYLNISDKNAYNKINAAYLQGGPEQAVKALNKNLDLNIDDYATFNWKAVADAINILGGIDLEISSAEFYYINAFITETVQATGIASVHLKQAGMNHLDGVQAVAYGRLRLMDSDYARTERQRKVISLAFEKAKQADWNTLNCIIQTVFPQVSTSVDMGDLLAMGRNAPRYHLSETMGFPAARSEVNMGSKGACVIPQTLESNVTDLHRFLFGDENYIPTETVQTISRKIIVDTGKTQKSKPGESVGTGGGAASESRETEPGPLEESGAEGSLPFGEGSEPGEENGEEPAAEEDFPGGKTEETDSAGNLIFPPGSRPGAMNTEADTEEERETAERESEEALPEQTEAVPGEGPIRPTGSEADGDTARPGEDAADGSTARPGGSEADGSTARPGGSEADGSMARPGAGEPGENGTPGTETSGGYAPGMSTDTGVILDPGSIPSTSAVEYTGPPGTS